jgi:peptidoglycan/LPS O-acetylase OafA/YrhL
MLENRREESSTMETSPIHRTHSEVSQPSTRYLNGLKGICALLVLVTHHEHWGRSSYESTLLERSYGYKNQYFFATLPFVRTIFSGAHFSVAMFFTISGYVLSLRPLVLIRDNQQSRLVSHLGSAICRRWLRLFLPVIGTIITFLTLWHVSAIDVPYMERQSSFRKDLEQFAGEICEFAWIFARDTSATGYGPAFSYNDHLWSIPLELRGSMVVFVSLLVTSAMTSKRRVICHGVLIVYLLYAVNGWYGAMFLMGTLICEYDLENASQPSHHRWSKIVPLTAFALGMYLAGVPHTPNAQSLSTNPGWYWLSRLKPVSMLDLKWFYLFWASALVVWSSRRVPQIKLLLDSQACQALAKISYSVYLVHGPVLWTVGDHLYMLSQVYIGTPLTVDFPGMDIDKTPKALGFELAFSVPCVLSIILTLLVASLHRSLIDVPSRNLSNHVYSVLANGRGRMD